MTNTTIYSVENYDSITARNALTGQFLWQSQMQLASSQAITALALQPDGTLFVSAQNYANDRFSSLYALNNRTGKEIWYDNITGVQPTLTVQITVGV